MCQCFMLTSIYTDEGIAISQNIKSVKNTDRQTERAASSRSDTRPCRRL